MKNIPDAIHWHCAMAAPPEGSIAARASPAITRNAQDLAALPSIAITPFRTSIADPEQVILTDGLRVDMQAALAKIAGLAIIGIGTTNTYRNKDIAPQQAAAEMGVRYLLEGHVQKSGDRVRMTVSLIDGRSGQVIWTQHYDREARAYAQEISAMHPGFSPEKWAETQPYKDRAVLDRILANLRSAGLT